VETFDQEVGLGEVRTEGGLLLPFHCTEIVDGSRSISVGTDVDFVVSPGQLGIWEARAVRPKVPS
jgi:cold shock CspA family protein